jgi:2-C-methyl-D-erythritol 4-phosphate cytidylyltransferase
MTVRYWAVVPAAGSSRRMTGATVPKQYLRVAGRSVIERAVAPLLALADCERVVVVLAADDRRWPEQSLARNPKILTATGGAERVDSVRAGLRALADHAAEQDWVLVHDAARPCLRAADLARLIDELSGDEVGGLLAAPVVDTLNVLMRTIVRRTPYRARRCGAR